MTKWFVQDEDDYLLETDSQESLNVGPCGGVQVVSVLAFYSDDPSLNPAEAYSFSVKWVFENNKNKEKRGRGWPILLNKSLNVGAKPGSDFLSDAKLPYSKLVTIVVMGLEIARLLHPV